MISCLGYTARILNLNFSQTLCELTNYLMLSYKNVPILIHLTQWYTIFFAWGEWHMVKMRLSTKGSLTADTDVFIQSVQD